MSKEYLEAFKIVYNNFDYLISDVCIENDDVNICLKTIKEQLPTIKQSLHRLESIDNANPSEALKSFDYIVRNLEAVVDDVVYMDCIEHLTTIKQALLKAQQEEIDKANTSEALECLNQFINEMTRCLENPKEYVKGYEKQIFWKYKNTLETTIKQALLKTQKQEAKFLDNLQRWFLLLGESGANTKYKVRDEMEAVIDELKEVLE